MTREMFTLLTLCGLGILFGMLVFAFRMGHKKGRKDQRAHERAAHDNQRRVDQQSNIAGRVKNALAEFSHYSIVQYNTIRCKKVVGEHYVAVIRVYELDNGQRHDRVLVYVDLFTKDKRGEITLKLDDLGPASYYTANEGSVQVVIDKVREFLQAKTV